MIRGKVERNADGGLEPWLTVFVEDSSGVIQHLDVILDTGFTGWLMLPAYVIDRLGLTREGDSTVTLASGSTERLNYYETNVLWHEQLRWVPVFESMDQSLLGMELLDRCRVIVDAWEGGDVIIEEVIVTPPA